jgi:L-fuconolactonase
MKRGSLHPPQPAALVTRREFLAGATVLSAAALAGCATRSPNRSATFIDTHTHFYDPSRPEGVPWPPPDDPLLHRTVLPAEFRRLAEPLGIGGTVVVEASPWVEDNQWVLDLAANEPFLMGLVGHLKPGHPGFADHLERFARNRRFRGIRTGLWGVKFDPAQDAMLQDLARLADRDLALDVLIGPDQLPAVAQLAEQLPTLRLVIDHCANVRIDGKTPPANWQDGLRRCSDHRNIFMKVSGLVEGTGRTDGSAPDDPEFYRPVLDAVWEAFGEDRVVFGSNWPVSARFASLATVQAIVAGYFGGHGVRVTEKFFRHNAVGVYRLA